MLPTNVTLRDQLFVKSRGPGIEPMKSLNAQNDWCLEPLLCLQLLLAGTALRLVRPARVRIERDRPAIKRLKIVGPPRLTAASFTANITVTDVKRCYGRSEAMLRKQSTLVFVEVFFPALYGGSSLAD
jgi:hypothetical protein